MQRLNIDITGVGPHTIIAAPPTGRRIILDALVLTFAHEHGEAQPVKFLNGSVISIGPFLMLNGGVFRWQKDTMDRMNVANGEAFCIEGAAGMRISGVVTYEIGSWQ